MTTLIWDLDGTLIDSYDVFLEALSETFATFDLPFDRKKVYTFIKAHSVNELLKSQKQPFEVLKTSFTENSIAKNEKIKLMTGAKEVLAWTKKAGIENFIYTHKGKNAYHLLEKLGIAAYFTEVITSENGFERKPHPAGVNYLLNKYGLDPHTTYYIGDRVLDAEVAYRSGIHSINFIAAKDSQQIRHLTDIIKILEKN